MKLYLCLAVSFAMFLSACSQNNASQSASSESTEPPVVKGAETAARFVVGRVTGPPVRAAMVANQVAHKVVDKVEGKPTPTPTPNP